MSLHGKQLGISILLHHIAKTQCGIILPVAVSQLLYFLYFKDTLGTIKCRSYIEGGLKIQVQWYTWNNGTELCGLTNYNQGGIPGESGFTTRGNRMIFRFNKFKKKYTNTKWDST